MSKKISSFILSLALVFCAFFGLTACKGPLDNLSVSLSSKHIEQTDGGYKTTLVLGTDEASFNISANVDGVGGDVSKQVNWKCSDTNKVSVTNIKYTNGVNTATITGLNVTQQGYPVKITVSSIEKTDINVVLFIDVVAEATKYTVRQGNLGVAVKGSKYVPNVQDYFDFYNDEDSTNVTIPNYDYTIIATLTDSTTKTLTENDIIPTNAQSLSIKFTPSADNIFDSELYKTQVLEVPSSQIVLYEPLENTDFRLKLDDEDNDPSNDLIITMLDLVLNQGNGQGQKFYIDGVNKDIMKVSYAVNPASFASFIDIQQDVNNAGVFYFSGQDETADNEVFIDFTISYNDPTITSKGLFKLPFRVVSYPNTITINSNSEKTEYNLTVYDYYATGGENLAISLSPYSSLFKNITISVAEDVTDVSNLDNLQWFVGNSTTPVYITKEYPLTIASGTRLVLKNALDNYGEYGNGTINFTVTIDGTSAGTFGLGEISRTLAIAMAHGIKEVEIANSSTTLNSADQLFYLSLGDTESVVSRNITLNVFPAQASAESLKNRFTVWPNNIVNVEFSDTENNAITFSVTPLKVGTATITWTTPTGKSISVDVRVFAEFSEYSLDLRGQTDLVGKVVYKQKEVSEDIETTEIVDGEEVTTITTETKLVDDKDSAGYRILESAKIATNSTIDFTNVLTPSNAYVKQIRYTTSNASSVKKMENTSANYASAQLFTGNMYGSAVVNCIVSYYVVDAATGQVLSQDKVYTFNVNTYNKINELILSDNNITLYAISSNSSAFIYNEGSSSKEVYISVDANGPTDVVLDDAEWTVLTKPANIEAITIKSNIVKQDGKEGVVYGGSVNIVARASDSSVDRLITTLQVQLKHYNTTLSAVLTVTVSSFTPVKNASFDVTNLNNFTVTENNQTGDNANKKVALYTESNVASDAYFTLRPTVTPVRATNKNLEYIAFDYEGNNIKNKTAGTASNVCNLVSVVDDKIVVNKTDEGGELVPCVGHAIIYVVAQDKLTKRVETIVDPSNIDANAILMSFDIVVSDGETEAYRIYNEQDFLKIYDQRNKNYVVMTDIYNVNIASLITSNDGSFVFNTNFDGSLSSYDSEVVRTITFTELNVVQDADKNKMINGKHVHNDSCVSVFGLMGGAISNLNIVLPKYSYTSDSDNSNVDMEVAALAQIVTGSITNVNFTVEDLDIDVSGNNHNSTTTIVKVGSIAEVTAEGSINNLVIFMPDANIKAYNYTNISAGVAQNFGVINKLTTSGNITLAGNTNATNINFGGAIAVNKKAASTDGVNFTYYVSNIESTVNLNSTINLSSVGGVVGENSGGLYDAKYMVIDDGTNPSSLFGLILVNAQNVGGVVGVNNSKMEYGYAISFVENFGIKLNSATLVGGVVGNTTPTEGDATKWVSKVFSAMPIITTTNILANAGGITGNGNNAQDFYSNSTYTYFDGTDSHTTEFKVMTQTTSSVWQNNTTFKNGFYQGGVYYYLVKDSLAYLPDIPMELTVNQSAYLVMEYLGTDNLNNNKYNHTPIIISDWSDLGVWTSGTVTQKSTKLNTFALFGANGLFVLNYPPVNSLNNLRIKVTSSNNNVVQVIPSTYAAGYQVQIMGNGTAVLNIISVLNAEANVAVQICVINGFANFTLVSTDNINAYKEGTDTTNPSINLKKGYAQEFSVNLYDINGNAVSAGAVQAGFDVKDYDASCISVTTQPDSFVIKNTTTNDCTANINKIIKASFYQDTSALSATVTKSVTTAMITHDIKTTTGPTAVRLNQNGVDIYAGGYVNTSIEIDCDDEFINDVLYIWRDGRIYAKIVKEDTGEGVKTTLYYANLQEGVYTYSTAIKDEYGDYIRDIIIEVINSNFTNGVQTFDIEYRLSNPASITQTVEYELEFEARPITEEDKGDVLGSYVLHIEPQTITALDMYHYTDVIEEVETGNLTQAGKRPSNTIVAGGYGLLKVTIDPYYVDFYKVELTSSVVKGVSVAFNQRVYDEANDVYVNLQNANIEVLSNGIATYKNGFKDVFAGTLYFRTYIPQDVEPNASFTINVNVYDKNNNIIKTASKLYSIYASSALSISYDNSRNAEGDEVNAYIAQNTGGLQDGDIYGQNTNIVSIFVEAGLIDPTFNIINYQGSASADKKPTLVEVESSKNVKLKTSDKDINKQYYIVTNGASIGDSFAIELSAKTYIAGILQTIKRTMTFKVVDIVINYKWNTPNDSEILQLALNGDVSRGIAAIGGAISNVVNGNWVFTYSNQPIQITQFVSDLRSNRSLLNENVDTLTEISQDIKQKLRNIPEFSFDVNDLATVKNVVAYLQYINQYKIGDDKYVSTFMYKQQNNYLGITSTTSFDDITFMVGQGTEEIKNYYIQAQSATAKPQLKSNFYVNYNADGILNNHLTIKTDGAGLYYNYEFGLYYEENTSKDHPIPVRTLEDLNKMEAGKDYILLQDIDLNEGNKPFAPITTQIASFDGNNHRLTLHGDTPFVIDNSSSVLGVFNTVASDTILKNVIVEIEDNIKINCINEESSGMGYTIGLLAGVNNGAITNCKVVSKTSLRNTVTLLSSSTSNSVVNFGGLVGSNQGYITNSNVQNVNFNTKFAVFGGLVSANNNVISASYVNDIEVNNTADDSQTPALTAVAGFVTINSGVIVESYVGGIENEDNNDITETMAKNADNRSVKITSNSDFAAFVFNNSGSVVDSFANATLDNATTTIVSGFVYTNSGTILRAYTASAPSNNENTYSRPFIGTTFNIQTNKETINNTGTLTNCYFYSGVYNDYQQGFTVIEEDGKVVKLAIGMTAEVMSTPSLASKWNGYSFASAKDTATGVWNPVSQKTLGPTLINANIPGMAEGVHQVIDRVETVSGNSALYYYTLKNKDKPQTNYTYNSKDCVALIYDAQSFNQMFNNTSGLNASNKNYYARIIKPIDLSPLTINNINLTTTTSILRGTIMGNNMTISGVDISYFDTSVNASLTGSFKEVVEQENPTGAIAKPTTSELSIGLFGEIRGGTVASVSIDLKGVYAETQARMFVGGLAGRVVDGTIYNLNITGNDATVLGRHLVGGVAGGVFGKSRISNINAGVSVTSAYVDSNIAEIYNHDILRMSGLDAGNPIKNLSVAGGLFGVVDLFDYTATRTGIEYEQKISESNTTKFYSNSLNFTGNGTIVGQTVGGVIGVVGCNTVLTNAATTVLNNTHLRASVFAGGLVGQNNGTITYSKVEYAASTQNDVNLANTGAVVDGANATVFNAINYTGAVGGLVGANFGQNYTNDGQTGVIRYANSSIYVDAPNAQNVGGLVGIVFGGDIRAVYASGYAVGVTSGNIGGLIGTVSEIDDTTNANIMPLANMSDNLLVKVKNPYNNEDAEIYPQTLLLDFAVAQTNWASNYYNYYANVQKYGYLGGLVGYATEQTLLTTSHNSENYKQEGFEENETVVINYYSNIITRNPVAVNANITENMGLKLNAFNIEINPVKEDSSLKTEEEIAAELTQKTGYLGQGDTRNAAYNPTTWDWFKLWDSYSISGRNADNTPILKQGFVDTEQKIRDTTDFLKVYWHPDGKYTLENDIYFTKEYVVNEQVIEKQIKYIMVGTVNLPFSGEFDGQGHTIYGLSVSNYLGNIGGLFGCVAGKEIVENDVTKVVNAVIKDVTLDGVAVSNVTYVRNENNVITDRIINNKYTQTIGGLAGRAENVDINNVVILNLKLDTIAENTNTNTSRYIGGLIGKAEAVNIVNCGVVGVNALRTNEEVEQGLYNGIKVLQQNTTLAGTQDELYVGGLIGKANVVKINKDAKIATLMTSANTDINMQNVYSNTYLGAGIGWADCVDANVFIIGGENKISGVITNGTKFIAGGYYGVLSGSDEENPNALYTGYAYSTIRSTLQNEGTAIIKLAYDFNLIENVLEYSEADEKPTTIINLEVSSIIASDKTLSQAELLNAFNAYEDNAEKTIDAKLRSYNATSIVSTGMDAALNVGSYYKTEEGRYKTGDDGVVQLLRNIPLDPYYSLVVSEDNYDITNDDLKTAAIVYPEILDFTKPVAEGKYGNSFGYVPGETTKITQQTNLLNSVFGKISKLYYIDRYGVQYGLAVVLTSGMSGDTFAQDNNDVYYILTRDVRLNKMSGQNYVFNNISGILNGHGHSVILTDATTLANNVSGILTGAKVQILTGTVNNESFKISGSFGFIANTLSEGGVVNACGSYAVQSTTTTAQDVETLTIKFEDTTANQNMFGGVVGVNNNGVVNNCWSHISYVINNEDYAAFGGIVGASNGGVLSNLNYYGDIIGTVAKQDGIALTTGGILGTATDSTDIYMVLSFIFAYSGTYHITKDQNIRLHEKPSDDIDVNTNTAVYFNISPTSDGNTLNPGVGEFIDFASVFENVDINSPKYRKAFVQYWGIWDKEEDGVNYGLPRLKIEPKVTSKGGRNEDDAIEVPNETIFAGMLQYEKNRAGRFYILTKEEDNGEYYLQDIHDIMNSFYSDATSNYETVNQDDNYYGHLLGNNKKLVWRSSDVAPKPLFNVFATSNTLYSGTTVVPYIKDLTLVNNSTYIPNLIANISQATISYVKFLGDSSKHLTITNPNGCYGAFVGENQGRIENCIIKDLNINIAGTCGGETCIGGLAGKHSPLSTIPISNTSLLNCNIVFDSQFNPNDKEIYVGGVVGYNTSKIKAGSSSTTKVKSSSFVYFLADTYVYYYTAANNVVEYDPETLAAISAPTNIAKCTTKFYKAGTYVRYKDEAEILLLGGEYQIYTILNYCKAHFNTSYNGFAVSDERLEARTGGADTEFTERTEFVVTEGQYTVYPYLDANLYSTGGLVRLWQGAVVDLGNNETWSYDEITISNNYRYVPKNDANFANWVLKSGTISIYDPKYIERRTDLIPIKLESNSSETAKFYYVYKDGSNYVLNYVSTNGKYNTGETEIWLIVLEGSLKNISEISSSNGEVYYIADSIWLEAKTQQSYYAGDESLTGDGNIVQVNIDTKNKINYVGGITGYNNKGSIEKMLFVGALNGYDYVGGITGYNNGEIIGSNITDVTINAHQYVGGIAGQNGGTIDNVTIKDATINATSSTSYAGGIAGSNQNEPYSQARITNGKLQNVIVNGSNNTAIITGYNNAEITISNSKGLVINKSTLNVSSVDYDVNNVENTMEIGLVTSYNEGIINFSASGSNMEISYDPDNSVITYINFTQKANWAGYNNDYTLNVGGIAGINKGVINSPSFIGSGINLEPQFTCAGKKIINFGGIAGINYLNASIRSVKAVKLDMESSFGTDPDPVNNNQVSDQLYLGGIAAINNGYISGGVGSVASKIEAPKACALGGVVAHNTGVVHNAYFNGTIKAQDHVGGIAGTNAGVIMASRYSGSIEAQDYVGGIAGVNDAGALVASVSISGTIKAQDYVGGIAGVNDGELSGANQVSIEDNQETALKLNTNDHVVFNGATIETDGINNATTSGVNTGVNSTYTITAEEGSTFTAFITKNTIQTISDGNVRINVLTEGASWINGESESSGNSITLTYGNTIKFNCDALLEYTQVDNNVTIKFTGGDVYLKNSNKIKIATDGSAAIDGYMKMGGDDINITVKGGSFYTTSDSNVTVVSNTTTAKLDGVAQFKQNDTVSVSSNSVQMYLNDTTSIINGSVTHSANTSVVMGDNQNSTTEILPQNAEVTYTQGTILNISVPRANPEKVGDDYYVKGEIYSTTGTNIIYMKYEKTADSYREAGYYKQDKTTRVYPKYENDQWDWFTDPECTQQDPLLNGRFYYVPDDNFGIDIKGKVKLGPKDSTYENHIFGSYQLTTINETIQNPSATEEQKTTDMLFKPVYNGNSSTQIDNNGYLTTSAFQTLTLKETIIYYHYYVETQENGSYSYTEVNTIDIDHRENAEHMLNIMVYCDQDTTIRYTYAKGTTVQVKGEQKYINETTSTYKNSIVKHFASTEIKLNGEDSVVSENFVTPTLIIYKPQSDIFTNVQECVVTMPNYQQFAFCGTQTFDTKTMINVSGRITVEEGGITEGANPIAEGSSTYDCDGPITLEANTKISSGTIGTSYDGQVDDKTYIITNNNTNITYNADSYVRYNQDTTSKINGTVIYPDGNLQVMYTIDSFATYPKDAQLIFKAGTTIYPSINFEFELFNSTKISVSDYDEDDVMHPGKIERHQQGGSSTEYTLSQNIVLNANDIIKVLSTNTKLTFEQDTSIKIISEKTCNTIKYLSNSQVNYTQGIEVKYNNATVTQPSAYNVMGADDYGMPIVYTFKEGATQNYGGAYNPTIYGLNNSPANINIQNATIVASGGAEFSYLGEVQSTDTDGLVTNSSNSISIYGKNFVGGAVGALTSNGTMENVELNNVDIYSLGGNFVGGVVGSAIGEVNVEQLDKYQYASYNGNTYRLNIANCSVRNVFIHYTGEADNKEYASYTGGFAGDLTSCYIYNSGVIDNLYIQGGYTIGGYAGSVGGGGNQGYYTMDFIITWGEGTVGGDNATKDVIFESCFLRDMKYNTGSAELFSNTDNPNGDFLNSWTSYEGGTSVWDAAGSAVRGITGGTQSADERNLSAVIGQIAVKDSYYDTKGGITVSGRINVNNPR